jgi:hypothetical protein
VCDKGSNVIYLGGAEWIPHRMKVIDALQW